MKSALYIDYENVGGLCPSAAIDNWMSWLEQGEFDEGRRRRFVTKRVYWNPSAQKYRETFEQHGFEVELCEKFHILKNGADIRIAIDIMESVLKKPHIDEYIIFAKDTDYVPVLQRLQVYHKQSAILVDENQERVYGVYDARADTVIPTRLFKQAAIYTRPEKLFARARALLSANRAQHPATQPKLAAGGVQQSPGASEPALAAVTRAVIRVSSLRPNQETPRKHIEAELRAKVPGFSTRGKDSYFGYQSFPNLMRAVQGHTDRILVRDAAHGGVSVRYIPREED